MGSWRVIWRRWSRSLQSPGVRGRDRSSQELDRQFSAHWLKIALGTKAADRFSVTAMEGGAWNMSGNSSTTFRSSRYHQFQIIKVAVLAVVTAIILLSVCKMIFQVLLRFTSPIKSDSP